MCRMSDIPAFAIAIWGERPHRNLLSHSEATCLVWADAILRSFAIHKLVPILTTHLATVPHGAHLTVRTPALFFLIQHDRGFLPYLTIDFRLGLQVWFKGKTGNKSWKLFHPPVAG